MGTHPKRSVSATSVPRHTSNWSFSVTGEQRQISFQDKDTEKRTISKKTRASATEIMQWQEPARHGQPPQKRGARVRRCRVRDAGRRSEEERRSEGAKERRSEEEPTRGYRRARRCTGLEECQCRCGGAEECQCRCRCRCRRGRGRGAWGQKSADAGLRKVSLQGSEKRRCKPGAGAGAGAGTEGREGRGGGKTNRRGAQKSVGTGAGAGADRTGPSGQRLRTRRPRRRARPTV